MMTSLAYGIVALFCFCCSVSSDGSNITSLLPTCSNGGCDFEFIIDQLAVEVTGMDELRSVVNNITIELPISGKAAGSVCSAVTKAIDTAENKMYFPGEQSYDGSMDRLKKMNVSFDEAMDKSQHAAQAIMEAALCFQSADPNINCGAMIPDKLV
uniref:Uncharacterized protein n=1 Tax=Plectus sambesii TaxID=2011161 RepID=A0A914WW54_9BILA